MASVDGVYVGPIALDEVPELVRQVRAGEEPLPAKQLIRRAQRRPQGVALVTDILLFENIDEPGLATREVYERRGGYDGAAQGAADARSPR